MGVDNNNDVNSGLVLMGHAVKSSSSSLNVFVCK